MNPETQKTLATSKFKYETFYYLWVKTFFDIRKEAKSFYADFSICPLPITCGARSAQIRLATTSPESQLSSSQAGTQIPDFFSNLSPRFRCVTSFTSRGHIFLSWVSIVTSLNDTSAPRARERLRSCLPLTNPCTKRKVRSLTQPKYIKRNPSAIIL